MPIGDDKFDSVSSKDLDKTQHTVEMEKNLENYDLVLKDANVEILKKILICSKVTEMRPMQICIFP